MNRLRSSNWPLIGLAAGMIVLALAGVALLVVYFLLARQPAANDAWTEPPGGREDRGSRPGSGGPDAGRRSRTIG